MCTVPPPPPPPPPPPTPLPNLMTKPSTNQINQVFIPDDLCTWALQFPELREACIKSNICINEPPYKYTYKKFKSIQQEGPTCGLVALSMLLNGDIHPTEILNIARIQGYSSRGEMLSCKNMVTLAKKVFSLANMDSVQLSSNSGNLYSEEIVNKVLNGSILLVPYDADFNHSPCLKLGHKAHWALVCGIIVINSNNALEEDNIYVLCKHGKSRFLAIWSLNELMKSNSNLLEFSPKREEEGDLYILPEEGIGGSNGLKDQFIIIEGLL